MRKLTAISEYGGIITYIREDGEVCAFAQRGVYSKLTVDERDLGIQLGLLDPSIVQVRGEVPSDVKLVYEEPSIQGKVKVKFPVTAFRKELSKRLKKLRDRELNYAFKYR